ncbi:MAG: ATP-dependent helicase [Theionarchaea archaeon]|nr:ATP-dependent helicase [Theionarchaea archaeon]
MSEFTKKDQETMKLFEDYVEEWMVSTFDRLTLPQREAWPLIASGENTLIFSPTGSGKTLAAFLFCINELFKLSVSQQLEDTIYVLYVSPLRALSNDIHKNLYQPLRGIHGILKKKNVHCQPIRSRVRTGDTTSAERAKMARKPPHILITTPETLYITLTTAKFRKHLKNIRYVIVDEIHALAGSKRGVQLSVSLERLVHLLNRNPVRIGLSATQSPVEEIAKFLVGMEQGIPRKCAIVNAGARKNLDLQVISPVDNLLDAKNDVVWNAAYLKLLSMIKAHETTLIFANSRYRTEHMTLQLRELAEEEALRIGSHHGSMSRTIRHTIENQLKHNELDAVIATSSLELGIDIGSIDLVCSLESPKSLSSGMQRIGRAGHLLKETSKGRIVATDPDDLVESAVLVRGISDGIIDTTVIPFNALDILAQQIVACVAADDWNPEELYALITQSYCYHTLSREDFEKTLTMLSSQISRNIYPKIFYDRVNRRLTGSRGSRNIAFRCGGAIPDVSNYDVYQGKSKIGTLDEGFVERIRPGDVFILGSQAWQMVGLDKKKVLVQNVAGVPPTIPYWGGVRPSRTYDLGVLVGEFRRKMEKEILTENDVEGWLMSEYMLDADGAAAVAKYYREQSMMLGVIPSDVNIVVESFSNELGHQQIAVHSPFGVRLNDIWGYALVKAAETLYEVRAGMATVDDGILLTLPEGVTASPEDIVQLVTPEFMEENIDKIIMDSPVFSSRFRHCAVRSFLILREYSGKRVPVWLQSLRAADLLEEVRSDREFPIVKEALRESVEEAFDLPHLMEILSGIARKELRITFCESRIPSPFIHQLLLVGQFGDFGQISNEERKLRLIHLHRQVLKQLIDEDLIESLLVEKEVIRVEQELQLLLEHQKARSTDELARILQTLGDLTTEEIERRVKGDCFQLLETLCDQKRVIKVWIPFGVPEERWIPTELYSLYRAAFARHAKGGPGLATRHSFHTVGVLKKGRIEEKPEEWIPEDMRTDKDRLQSCLAIMKTFFSRRGPVAKYELMERYGLSSEGTTTLVDTLEEEGVITHGSFMASKDTPQWCWRRTLEELHRRSLYSLREQVKPLSADRYVDFMLKWQNVHPQTNLQGKEGVIQAVKKLETWEEHITCWERYLLSSRVRDYRKKYLNELVNEKRISFGRFNELPPHERYNLPNRGIIQLYCTEDANFVVNGVIQEEYYEDLKKECDEIIEILGIWPSLSLEGIVTGAQMERTRVMRALLRLFQLGIVENDSYESVRESVIISGMSAAWDLTHTPEDVSDDIISRNIRKKRIRVDKGRWSLVKRPVPSSSLDKVRQIFTRYGIVTRDLLKVNREAVSPQDFSQAVKVLMLRGEVREGRFIEEVDGMQYATPEAVDMLRNITFDDQYVILCMKDPANLYGKLIPIENGDNPVKHAVAVANHIIIKRGRPVSILTSKNYPERYFNIEMSLLQTVTREEMISLLYKVIEYGRKSAVQKKFRALRFASFNEVPVEESEISSILERLGFSHAKNGYILLMNQEVIHVDGSTVDAPEIFERTVSHPVVVQESVSPA